MNTRALSSLAMAVFAASVLAGCGKQQETSSGETADAAHGMRYEAHLAAGGSLPPGLPPPQPPNGHADDAKTGETLFASMNCDGCHGGGGLGWVGPSLVDGRWRYGGDEEELFQSIFYGRPKGMPAYGGLLGSGGVWAIVMYLKSQPVPAVVPTTNYEELTSPPVTQSAAPESESSLPSEGLARIAQYGCVACHAIDRKVVGPAYRDVAAKYSGDAGAELRLVAKVKSGGSGVWGAVPMPPNAHVPDAELREIVHWILTSPDVHGS